MSKRTANEGLRLAQAHFNRMALEGSAPTATQISALSTLMHVLNGIGLSKFHLFYPFIGGTAATHALDVLGAYDITWSGTVTHNSSGATPNGTTGYGDSGLNGSSLTGTDCHLSAYSTGGSTGSFRCLLGNGTAAAGFGLTALGALDAGGKEAGAIAAVNDPAPDDYLPADAEADTARDHFHLIDSTTALAQQFYRDGVAFASSGTGRGTIQSGNLFIGARNNGGASGYDDATLKSISIGLHLTAAEVLTYYTAVQAFQTALARNN